MPRFGLEKLGRESHWQCAAACFEEDRCMFWVFCFGPETEATRPRVRYLRTRTRACVVHPSISGKMREDPPGTRHRPTKYLRRNADRRWYLGESARDEQESTCGNSVVECRRSNEVQYKQTASPADQSTMYSSSCLLDNYWWRTDTPVPCTTSYITSTHTHSDLYVRTVLEPSSTINQRVRKR